MMSKPKLQVVVTCNHQWYAHAVELDFYDFGETLPKCITNFKNSLSFALRNLKDVESIEKFVQTLPSIETLNGMANGVVNAKLNNARPITIRELPLEEYDGFPYGSLQFNVYI